MLTAARKAAISLAPAFLVIFTVAPPTKITHQDLEETARVMVISVCYGFRAELRALEGIQVAIVTGVNLSKLLIIYRL